MRKILVAEDEQNIREFVVINLKRAGYEAVEAANGEEALRLYEQAGGSFDMAILDIMMPGAYDGLEVCKRLRKQNGTIGIILLTAKTQEMDKVTGLMTGADDYVTKPFNPVTLGAKVKALIRRSRNGLPGADSLITAGPFTYNTSTLRFYKNGVEIPLSAKENAMMKLFIDNVNRIFSKDMLYDLLWGEAIIDENAIMVYVNRLRAKIEEDPAHPAYIQTVRGLGYRFVV